LVFASSCSVYGYQDGLLNEASPCDPLSEYARLKLAAEPLMHNHDAVILRFGTAFGAPLGFCRPRLDLAINRMAVRGAARGVIDVCGGEQWRPWASIRDLAYAVCQALNYRIPPGTYNIASENATLGDAAARIAETLEPLHIVLDERPADDPRNYHVDTSAAKLLGLILPEPLCTIEDAARELALLVLSGRIPDWRDALFVNAAWLKQRGTPCRLNV
jgi:nucleoside-diphosphate-sugar epimerase